MIDLSSVVVTGLGTLNAAGRGRDDTGAALREARTPWREIDRSAGYHRRGGAELGGLTAGLDLSPWLSARAARRMSLPSKLAVAATRMALEDAALDAVPADTAVMASNSYGPSSWVEKFFVQVLDDGPMSASPALFTETVANAPAAQVAMACGATGPNVTVTQREIGALIALARGAGEIARGRVGGALVVAVDELTPLLHAALDRFQGLAHRGADGRETARPFDRRRDGFIAAEGATTVVLEPETAARRRGGHILARLRSASSAFDPRAPRNSWSTAPDLLSEALRRHLEAAGLVPGDIDGVVAGASGTRVGDALEAGVLKAVWGEPPPIAVPKAVLGEHGGAALAAAILALEGASFGPVAGFEADPELGIVPNAGWPAAPARILVSGLASGGAAAWVVLEKGER